MIRHAAADTLALTGRSLRHILRSPDTVITTAIMPVAMMLLFVYVFGGAIDLGSGSDGYATYLLPGILLITVTSGVSYTALRVFTDRSSGVLERLRAMPVARSAVLWAHVTTSLVANALAVCLVLAAAVLVGARPTGAPVHWLAAVGLLALFTLALTWLAVLAGVSGSSAEGAGAFAYPLAFLPFLSSAFVPTGTMPGPLRLFTENQPLTPLIDALRALLAGQDPGSDAVLALAWGVGLLVLCQWLATSAYRRRAARGML